VTAERPARPAPSLRFHGREVRDRVAKKKKAAKKKK